VSEEIGVVHPELSGTIAGMFLFLQDEINILIFGLLPDLELSGGGFVVFGVVESLEGKAFCFGEVLVMNCLLTQLWPQWVVSN